MSTLISKKVHLMRLILEYLKTIIKKTAFLSYVFIHLSLGEVLANDLFNHILYDLVLTTPEIEEAKQNIALSDFEIELLTNETGPKVNFSTDGNYPVKSNISPRNTRVSSADEQYIDGRLSLDAQIYDFGAQNELIKSETFKKLSNEIELKILEQDIYFDLLKTGFEIIALTQNIKMIEEDIELHNIDRTIIKQRFVEGTGTSLDIKEAELITLNLENEYRKSKFDLDEREAYFLSKFGQSFELYRMEIEKILKLLPEPETVFEIEKGLKIRKLNYEIQSVESEIKSINKSKLPAISSSMSLNMYNLDDGSSDDYSITGGITISIPLYDTGVSKSKERLALTKVNIIKTQITKERNIWKQKWDENNIQILKLKNQIELLTNKKIELIDKYELLQTLSKTLKANFMETTNARVELRQLQREENQLKWKLSERYLENAYLRENLLING